MHNELHPEAKAGTGTLTPPATGSGFKNVISVDVEDYFHAESFADTVERSQWGAYASRVESNTKRFLELLAELKVEATVFVLRGEACPVRRGCPFEPMRLPGGYWGIPLPRAPCGAGSISPSAVADSCGCFPGGTRGWGCSARKARGFRCSLTAIPGRLFQPSRG